RNARATLRALRLKDNTRDSIIFSVAEGDKCRRDASFCRISFGRPCKNQERFAALSFAYIDVAPAHRFADPSAEGFCHRLFASETRSEMSFREFHRHRILDFTVCENAVQKPIPESLDRTLDPRAFDHINADTNNAHKSSGPVPDDSHV